MSGTASGRCRADTQAHIGDVFSLDRRRRRHTGHPTGGNRRGTSKAQRNPTDILNIQPTSDRYTRLPAHIRLQDGGHIHGTVPLLVILQDRHQSTPYR